MGIQSSAAISTALGARFFTGQAQRAARDFLAANNVLVSDRFAQRQSIGEGLLNRRLTILENVSSVDQEQKALQDVVTDILGTIKSELQQIQTLIDDTQTTPANAAINQSQIEAIVESVASELGEIAQDDPFADANVIIEEPVANSNFADAQVFRLDSFFDSDDDRFQEFDINISDTGSRSRVTAALDSTNGVAGQFDNNLQFSVTGPNGTSGIINITSGDTVADVVTAINELAGTTGIFAEVNAGDANQIDIFAQAFGAETVSITDEDQAADTQSEITNFGIDASGTDASASAVINRSDDDLQIREVDFDGRVGRIGLSGVDVEIVLSNNSTNVADSADPGIRFIRVFNGGRQIVGFNGGLNEQVSTRFLNFSSFGRENGGLSAINVTTDTFAAERIIDEALEQIDIAIGDSSFIADNLLGNRISAASTQIDTIGDSLTEIRTFFDALRVADSVTAEAEATSALTTLSSLSTLFPTATTGLL